MPALPTHLTTPQCILHWIGQTPDAIAVTELGRSYTYRDLGGAIVRFTHALRASSVGPGMLVGIECTNRYLHLVLMLACRLVGATTISLSAVDVATDEVVLPRCDFLCLEHEPGSPPRGMLMLTRETIDRIMSRSVPSTDFALLGDDRARPADPRLVKTSGTTGRPKVMSMTDTIIHRVIAMELGNPDDPGFAWDYLCIYNFTFRGAQREVELTLRQGATAVFTDVRSLFTEMDRFDAFRVTLMPGDVIRLHEAIPADWPRPRTGMMYVKGGPMPASIRAVLQARVVTHLEHQYASNETHTLAVIEADGVGVIHRDATIRIVDDNGQEVPFGEVGVIEARTPWMADRYLWDEDATALAFRDGWYRTNDVARMVRPGALVLMGRADDMIILGGIKLAPQGLESRIRDLDGIQDAVLVSLPNPAGQERLVVVVESSDPRIAETAGGPIAAILAQHIGGAVPIVRRALPRTETGKVRRMDLRDALVAGL